MKEIMHFSHYEAKDDSFFSDRNQCKIYETILENPTVFFGQHFEWAEPRDFRNPEKAPWLYYDRAILVKPFTNDELYAAQCYLDKYGLDRVYGLLHSTTNIAGTVFLAKHPKEEFRNEDWEAIGSKKQLEEKIAFHERMIKAYKEKIAILDKYSAGGLQ